MWVSGNLKYFSIFFVTFRRFERKTYRGNASESVVAGF